MTGDYRVCVKVSQQRYNRLVEVPANEVFLLNCWYWHSQFLSKFLSQVIPAMITRERNASELSFIAPPCLSRGRGFILGFTGRHPSGQHRQRTSGPFMIRRRAFEIHVRRK
jgi:hypothetical protein